MAIELRTVTLNLERLRRHHEVCAAKYDEVSLLDLANALRQWADMKVDLQKLVPAFAQTLAFRSSTPGKELVEAAFHSESAFAFMATPVKAYAPEGGFGSVTREEEWSACFCEIQVNHDRSAEYRNFAFVASAMEDWKCRPALPEKVTKLGFACWMGADALRMAYVREPGTLTRLTFSREKLIRCVANTLGGSHPALQSEPGESINPLSHAVRRLFRYQVMHLPLPYFVLLKIAQDILEIAPRLLSK